MSNVGPKEELPARLPALVEADLRFIEAYPHAAMITVGTDGRPKAVKMEAAAPNGLPPPLRSNDRKPDAV